MNCHLPHSVHTIGHSTRTTENFLTLLRAHGTEALVDVRRWPSSRRCPHFGRKALEGSLNKDGIDYIWHGDLGGFRKPAADSKNTAWKVGSFRAYADFMLTAEFARIMQEVEELAANKKIAIMCAEAVPWRCHRQLLADAFLVRGFSVRHIMDDGCHEHRLPAFAISEGRKIFYPATAQLELAKL